MWCCMVRLSMIGVRPSHFVNRQQKHISRPRVAPKPLASPKWFLVKEQPTFSALARGSEQPCNLVPTGGEAAATGWMGFDQPQLFPQVPRLAPGFPSTPSGICRPSWVTRMLAGIGGTAWPDQSSTKLPTFAPVASPQARIT